MPKHAHVFIHGPKRLGAPILIALRASEQMMGSMSTVHGYIYAIGTIYTLKTESYEAHLIALDNLLCKRFCDSMIDLSTDRRHSHKGKQNG